MKYLLFFLLCLKAFSYELSIGAIFQNEAPYLKEWIEFHKLVGVDHFYLYENGSSDDYKTVLQPYIETGEVELIEWPHRATSWSHWLYEVQGSAYADCIQRATHKTRWLALIDIDEFLTPISSTTVPDILKDYESYGGVGFNWKIFGHSDLFDLPDNQLLIESLIMTAPHDRSTHLGTKTIVRPECVADCKHPHYVIFKEGYYEVDSNKDRSIDENGSSAKIYYDRLAINHYWSRTGRYLRSKLERYKPWFPDIIPEKWPLYVEGMNEVRDRTMEPFIAPLRKKMALQTLDAYLSHRGFQLTPAGKVNEEGYVTPAQKQAYIEELRKHPSIRHVAEVGFNAGHTAEIFLETLPNCRLTSFDLNTHFYTPAAVQFFETNYKERFQFIAGDSRTTVPAFNEKFDLIYIDGCHTFDGCFHDILNFKKLAHKETFLWIDDTNFPDVKRAVELAERLRLIHIIQRHSAEDVQGPRAWTIANYVFP